MIDKKRRKLMNIVGATTVAVPVSALIGTLPSHADDLPMVDETSPAAVNWLYVAQSETADSNCANCALYQGEADAKGGPCPLFQGEHVATAGWCKAWAPKPS